MSIIEQADAELRRAGWCDEHRKSLVLTLQTFFEGFDSGGAVWATTPVLMRLIAGQPLSPLTGEDDEWYEPMPSEAPQMFQNKRCSSVFKRVERCDSGTVHYRIFDIDNDAWDGTFPYDPATKMPADPVVVFGVADVMAERDKIVESGTLSSLFVADAAATVNAMVCREGQDMVAALEEFTQLHAYLGKRIDGLVKDLAGDDLPKQCGSAHDHPAE